MSADDSGAVSGAPCTDCGQLTPWLRCASCAVIHERNSRHQTVASTRRRPPRSA